MVTFESMGTSTVSSFKGKLVFGSWLLNLLLSKFWWKCQEFTWISEVNQILQGTTLNCAQILKQSFSSYFNFKSYHVPPKFHCPRRDDLVIKMGMRNRQKLAFTVERKNLWYVNIKSEWYIRILKKHKELHSSLHYIFRRIFWISVQLRSCREQRTL